MAQAFQDHVPHHGIGAIQGVAGAGIVDQRSVGVVRITAIVQPAQAQDRPGQIAFAGMIEDQIQNHADAGGAQRGDGVAQFVNAAGHQLRIQRHRRNRIVAPGIAQAQRRQMPFIDPGDNRHQFDGTDAQFVQMGDDGGMRQRRDRSAQIWRDVGMLQGEAAHIQFIDQSARLEDRWRRQGRSVNRA